MIASASFSISSVCRLCSSVGESRHVVNHDVFHGKVRRTNDDFFDGIRIGLTNGAAVGAFSGYSGDEDFKRIVFVVVIPIFLTELSFCLTEQRQDFLFALQYFF